MAALLYRGEIRELGRESQGMALFAAATRRCQGQRLGGEVGRSLLDQANRWMAEQEIRSPARMTMMYLPGFED